MAGVNKVILIGNLGKDPEIITFETAKKATFPLATTEYFKNKDGQIYNIYTFADGKYVTLTNFSYFFNATINTSKNIYAYNYHGAQCYDSIEYKIKGNGKDIYGVQAVTSLGSGVIRDFDYGYGSSQAFKSNKKEVDWKKMKAISLNEYLAKRDKISEEYKISDFTPLVK